MNLNQHQKRSHSIGVALGISLIMLASLVPEVALAASQNLAGVATKITSNFAELSKLISATAYIGGLGFAVGSILKFKQHKDNPTQVPIGTPVAMLIVAAAMIFMPTIIGITQQSIFGGTATAGGAAGVDFAST